MPRNFLFTVVFMFSSLACFPGVCFSKTFIKVCILNTNGSVKVSGSGSWLLTDALSGRRLKSGNEDRSAIVGRNGRFLNLNGKGSWIRFKLSPSGRGAFVSANGRRYRGRVSLWADGDHGIVVVNEIDLEEYLYGVVKAEMLISSPPEALKSQAVMSRTFALKGKKRHGNTAYDLCSTTHCQVYGGVESEDPRAKKAVDHTRGYVLMYQGELIKAFCTAVCGGHSSANHLVWSGRAIPYLRGVLCSYCGNSPNFMWEIKFSDEDLGRYLRSAGFDLERVEAIEAVEVTPSGRVRTLIIHHPAGQFSIGGNKFRLAIDPRALKSTMFSVIKIKEHDYSGKIERLVEQLQEDKQQESSDQVVRDIIGLIRARRGDDSSGESSLSHPEVEEKQQFLFRGKGYGHGVGLCQWGARNMAKRRYRFQNILKHYYPGVKVQLYR